MHVFRGLCAQEEMRMRRLAMTLTICGLLLAALGLLPATPAEAITITPSGAELTVDYDEPTTNADGTALDDLKITTIWYQVQGTPAPVKALEVAATQAAGGGHISKPITVPTFSGKLIFVDVWATATDRSGNESAKSNIVAQRVDLLPPAAPK